MREQSTLQIDGYTGVTTLTARNLITRMVWTPYSRHDERLLSFEIQHYKKYRGQWQWVSYIEESYYAEGWQHKDHMKREEVPDMPTSLDDLSPHLGTIFVQVLENGEIYNDNQAR